MHRFATTVLALLFITSSADAQWARVDVDNGIPAGLTPAALTWNGTALYSLHLQTGPSALRMYTSTDAGGSWTEVPDFPGATAGFNWYGSLDGRLVAAGITNDASFAYFRMSDDGGSTWTEVLAEDIGGPMWLARRGSTMFAGTTIGVAKSTDDGATWEMTGAGLPTAGFVLATDNALIAQAGTGSFRSTDDGANWSQIFIEGSINLFSRPWVDDGVIYMKDQVTANIHASTDEGATWTTYTSFSQFGFTTVLVQPGTETWIPYAVSSGGATFHTTSDLAVTAEPIDVTGYPTLTTGQPCFASPIVSPTAVFVTANLCFNDNNGIYRHNLSEDTAVEPVEIPTALRVEAPYPNPATGRAGIPVSLDRPSIVDIRITDVLGRVMRTSTTSLAAGPHTLPADLNGLAPGVYGITVSAGRSIETRSIILID